MEEKRKAPELRFPGFADDWEQRKFGDLYKKVSEKNDLSYGVDDIISVANMYYKEDVRITDSEYLKSYNVFHVGDIAFEGNRSKKFAHGRFVENTIGNGIISHVFDVFHPKMEYDLYFWKYFINDEQVMGRILTRCTKASTMMTSLVAKDFLREGVLVPSLEEQDRIGKFLKSLDEAIALHQRKENLLRELKKGMLQKIFSQEIRFKDDNGQDFPDWEENKLGSVCDTFYAGQTPTSSNAEYYHGNIPWVASGDLNRGIITRTEKNITEEGKNSARLKLLPKGSFLISLFGQEAPNVCGNCGILGIDATINQACMCIIPKKEKLLPTFLFQWYLYVGKSYGHRYPQGTKQQNYNVELIRDFNIFMPKNIVEQAKIADYLAHIDARITAEQKKVSSLQTMKKGFLQKMFV